VRLRKAGVLVVLLVVASGCGSSRWRRAQNLCLESMQQSGPPLRWQADWAAHQQAVLYDWRLTLGVKSSNDSLPWVEHLEGAEVWFGPASFAAALEGEIAYPGPEPYPIADEVFRDWLQKALEVRESGADPHRDGSSYVLMALLLTGRVAVRDSVAGAFVSHVHVLRLGLSCGGLSGYGSTAFYLPDGRRFLLVGEWEA
jgi:hypothetical protein